jgi:glycosyltransferase involved in cell wall biosynthesis
MRIGKGRTTLSENEEPIAHDLPSKQLSGKTLMLVSNTFWSLINFRGGLIRALIDQGADVIVLAPWDRHAQALSDLGCKVVSLEMSREGLNPIKEFGTIFHYALILRKYSPSLCLLYTVKPNLYGSLASILTRVPVFCTITGLGTAFIAGGILSLLAEWSFKLIRNLPKRTFLQNRDDFQLFLDRKLISRDKMRLVSGSGVNLKFFSFSPMSLTDKTIFLFVGRIVKDKGIQEYVMAARLVRQNFPNSEFWIAGALNVPNRTAVDSLTVKKWQQEGTVQYLGEVESIKEIIEASQCVVLPSYREGLPRCLMEACAVGRPVIATDVPGCRDIVEPNHNGYLCRPKDAFDLYEKMSEFIQLSDQGKIRMGMRARAKAEKNFGEEAVIASYLEEINQVLDQEIS